VNYRHQFHAGNFADVMKHAVLVQLIRGMQAKEKGFLYLDTHAGRGGYDLDAASSGLTQPRAPEWPDGIGRLWTRRDLPAELADYLEQVRTFDAYARTETGAAAAAGASDERPIHGPRFYPGSPRLAQGLLRPQDRAMLYEAQPDEAAALAQEFIGAKRVSVHAIDGYTGVKAALPPPERRALVLIDPPFEAQEEWSRIIAAITAGLARTPAATFAVWYPLTTRAKLTDFYRQLMAIKILPPCYTVELTIAGEEAGFKMRGSAVLVLNPPWGSEGPIRALTRYLTPILAQAEGATGGLHWLVPDL
jgi:23S rRNA (adenine2030-N6)-methyltransferase